MAEKKNTTSKHQPLVSIVTPVHNGKAFFADTIETVCAQSYKNWEWIIVDDNSDDGTQDVIRKEIKDKKLDRVRLIELKERNGAANSRNAGIEVSKGRFICFLDADDLWDKEKMEKQVAFMQKKDCGFSYHSYEFADKDGIPNGKKVIAKNLLSYKQALKNNIISTITVMIDTNKIDKGLVKMPDIQYVEDTATWWKILRNGYIAYGIPDIFSYYRRTPKTSSSKKIKTQKPLWFLYRREENLNLFYAFYCLSLKNYHALLRRI